jgi:hypothetical protein
MLLQRPRLGGEFRCIRWWHNFVFDGGISLHQLVGFVVFRKAHGSPNPESPMFWISAALT